MEWLAIPKILKEHRVNVREGLGYELYKVNVVYFSHDRDPLELRVNVNVLSKLSNVNKNLSMSF